MANNSSVIQNLEKDGLIIFLFIFLKSLLLIFILLLFLTMFDSYYWIINLLLI